ncbi:MAG: hypothetical protein E8D42_07785 [Nitrospira sp.]|nr:MAG: hypothetical protein E8D42_07785 [Nitrospira sp.]
MNDLFTATSHDQTSRKTVREFNYTDEGGTLLYQVVREDLPNGKKNFQQRRPDQNGGWIWNLRNTRRVLYRLPNILQEQKAPIILHEGEKAVEAAVLAGLPGLHSTTAGGSNAPRHTDFGPVKGRDVIICPDNDDPGENYLQEVTKLVTAAGATSVKVLRLPGLPSKGDLVEWLQAGGTAETFAALIEQGEHVTSAIVKAAPIVRERAIFRRVSDIQAKPINWLWNGRIARGKVSMIAGNPGLGKSQVTASMAAIVSMSGAWPDNRTACEVSNVVILSAEDDPADTIRPRLEAAKADLSRVFILDAVTDGTLVNGSESRRGFNLRSDLSRLGTMLEEIGGAALIVIDPITAYLGTTDSHKNAEIRALLSPLAELAAKHEAAVVRVSHFNKNSTGEALMRVTGSLAFVAAARAAFVVARDHEHEARRLFLPLKNNLGNDQTGLAFTMEPIQVESATGQIETSRVLWEAGTVTTTAQEAMAPHEANEAQSDLDDAKDFLRELLIEGAQPAKLIRTDAEDAGHAWRTIQRAQRELGVIAFKKGMKEGWFWRLDSPPRPEERQNTTKNATPRDWQPSHSSGRVGGLRSGDRKPIMELSETFRSESPLVTDEIEEVIDL